MGTGVVSRLQISMSQYYLSVLVHLYLPNSVVPSFPFPDQTLEQATQDK